MLHPTNSEGYRMCNPSSGNGMQEVVTMHEALVTEFALSLVLHTVRTTAPTASLDAHLRGLLDPLADPLSRLLTVRDTACVALALKSLAALAPAQLPGTAAVAPVAGERALDMLQKLPDVSTAAAQVSLLAPEH
jgi:hypothetical protein